MYNLTSSCGEKNHTKGSKTWNELLNISCRTKDVNYVIDCRKMAMVKCRLVNERMGSKRGRKRERCRDVGSSVRACSDMLDVDGTGVVWHITLLIQCISGCEQLARDSQPLQFTLLLLTILLRINLFPSLS